MTSVHNDNSKPIRQSKSTRTMYCVLFLFFLGSVVRDANGWLFEKSPKARIASVRKKRDLFRKNLASSISEPLAKLGITPFIHKSILPQHQVIDTLEGPTQATGKPGSGMFGTPWTVSIDNDAESDCLYMPFWEWQLEQMQDELKNFEILDDTSCYMESEKGGHRMATLTASSDEYRYVRMTYMDGGDKVQVFTCLMYPRGNHPLFGIDLLRFNGGKRNMVVCDFQPIHTNESDHQSRYEHLLEPIRNKAPNLKEEMSNRVFDPSRHFSNYTLMSRFEDCEDPQQVVWQELLPAYQSYFKTHLALVQEGVHNGPCLSPGQILDRHRVYDNYMLERDPAHKMFASIFGQEVAEKYVYDVLFLLADRKPED